MWFISAADKNCNVFVFFPKTHFSAYVQSTPGVQRSGFSINIFALACCPYCRTCVFLDKYTVLRLADGMANDSNAVWIITWILLAYSCIVFCFVILKLCQRHVFQGLRRASHITSQTQIEESALVLQHLPSAPTESAYTSVLVGISSWLLRKPIWYLISMSPLSSKAGARRSPDRDGASRKLPLPARRPSIRRRRRRSPSRTAHFRLCRTRRGAQQHRG